ncbi:hypothetical protein C7R88_06400 [Plesiomonas shigelloides]|nr:hypothetical protein C7R88_06400 [Plesiomonas shigelloides]
MLKLLPLSNTLVSCELKSVVMERGGSGHAGRAKTAFAAQYQDDDAETVILHWREQYVIRVRMINAVYLLYAFIIKTLIQPDLHCCPVFADGTTWIKKLQSVYWWPHRY